MDSDGNSVSNSGLTFSTDVIKATLPIMQVKEVPLTVTLINGGGATSDNCTVTIEPKTIKLAGDSKVLDGINKLSVATIDLADFTASFEQTYPIAIEDKLQNVTGVTSASVKIVIAGLTTKTFNVTNITCTNVPEGYTVSKETQNISVVMRGTETQLAALKDSGIRAVADMTEYKDTSGTVMPSVKIYTDGIDGVGAVGSYKITVTLTKG